MELTGNNTQINHLNDENKKLLTELDDIYSDILERACALFKKTIPLKIENTIKQHPRKTIQLNEKLKDMHSEIQSLMCNANGVIKNLFQESHYLSHHEMTIIENITNVNINTLQNTFKSELAFKILDKASAQIGSILFKYNYISESRPYDWHFNQGEFVSHIAPDKELLLRIDKYSEKMFFLIKNLYAINKSQEDLDKIEAESLWNKYKAY